MSIQQHERVNTLFSKAIDKLTELNMSDEETMQVLSRAIVASAVAMNKGSIMINYGNNTCVNVQLPDEIVEMEQQATTQSNLTQH